MRKPKLRSGPGALPRWTLLLPMLFIAIAGLFVWSTIDWMRHGVHVEGVVTGVERRSSGDGSTYYPSFAYDLGDGVRREGESNVGSDLFDYARGERVGIYVRPDRPGEVLVDSFIALWLFPLVFGGVGTLFLVIMLFLTRRRTPAPAPVSASRVPSYSRPPREAARPLPAEPQEPVTPAVQRGSGVRRDGPTIRR